jgi:hypothetical protein
VNNLIPLLKVYPYTSTAKILEDGFRFGFKLDLKATGAQGRLLIFCQLGRIHQGQLKNWTKR